MKRFLILLLLVFFMSTARSVQAQSATPPAGLVGEIHGTVINRNTGQAVTESLDVMLHVLDQSLADKDMQHAQSANDGTFTFANIPFEADLQFVMMATYKDVTYASEPTPVDLQSRQVNIDVPVYETTSDLAGVQIDQMHVMFDFDEDGLETKEIYVISHTGERTVKDAYQVDEQHSATLKFPLPIDADYIFFKPDEQDRFIKFGGGFADTNPLLPTSQSSQFMVSYLVPYLGQREYTYTAPLNVAQINFLVPAQSDISLQGSALSGPESMTLENNMSYNVYSYTGLNKGQTIRITIAGKIPTRSTQSRTTNPWLAIGAAFVGFAAIGEGIWWWRKPTDNPIEVSEVEPSDETLNGLLIQIAKVDEEYEQGQLSAEAHEHLRQELMRKAKRLL